MRARDYYARAARRLAHVEKIKFHAVAGVVLLADDALFLRHYRLGLVVEADEYLVALGLEYRAGDDVSYLVGELLVDNLALRVLELLNDDLARRLSGDASEILGQHLGADDVADLEVLVAAALRLFGRHLRVSVHDLADYLVDLVERYLSALYVDVDFYMLVAALELFVGGDHRGLKARDYRLLGKPLLLFYLFQNFFKIFAKLHFSSPTPFCVMNYFFFFGIFLNVFFCPRCGT